MTVAGHPLPRKGDRCAVTPRKEDVLTEPHEHPVPQMVVGVSLDIQQVPSGEHWVILRFDGPMMSFAIMVPPAQVDIMADKLPEELRTVAKEARRQDSGLIVPNTIEGL